MRRICTLLCTLVLYTPLICAHPGEEREAESEKQRFEGAKAAVLALWGRGALSDPIFRGRLRHHIDEMHTLVTDATLRHKLDALYEAHARIFRAVLHYQQDIQLTRARIQRAQERVLLHAGVALTAIPEEVEWYEGRKEYHESVVREEAKRLANLLAQHAQLAPARDKFYVDIVGLLKGTA